MTRKRSRLGKDVAPLTHLTRADCPQCGRRLLGIPYYRVAVNQSTRTCPQCKTLWRILATPVRFNVTKLDWLAL
jgi:predicted RNA-binding Zn-ribbon protein involved in translation (DUF1610 family)